MWGYERLCGSSISGVVAKHQLRRLGVGSTSRMFETIEHNRHSIDKANAKHVYGSWTAVAIDNVKLWLAHDKLTLGIVARPPSNSVSRVIIGTYQLFRRPSEQPSGEGGSLDTNPIGLSFFQYSSSLMSSCFNSSVSFKSSVGSSDLSLVRISFLSRYHLSKTRRRCS